MKQTRPQKNGDNEEDDGVGEPQCMNVTRIVMMRTQNVVRTRIRRRNEQSYRRRTKDTIFYKRKQNIVYFIILRSIIELEGNLHQLNYHQWLG